MRCYHSARKASISSMRFRIVTQNYRSLKLMQQQTGGQLTNSKQLVRITDIFLPSPNGWVGATLRNRQHLALYRMIQHMRQQGRIPEAPFLAELQQ